MIIVEYNTDLPKNCYDCPLYDCEFRYCHGHSPARVWDCTDIDIYTEKLKDCPLIEVENETERNN